MNDITKLPKWARHEIERLRVNAKAMELDMAAIVGATPTKIEIDPYRHHRDEDMPRLFIPEKETVAFTIDGGRIDVRLRDNAVEICAVSLGERSLVVQPHVSNVIVCRFEKD